MFMNNLVFSKMSSLNFFQIFLIRLIVDIIQLLTYVEVDMECY